MDGNAISVFEAGTGRPERADAHAGRTGVGIGMRAVD
jgi:hypothetical protein